MNTRGESCLNALHPNLRNAANGLSADGKLLAGPNIRRGCSGARLVEREGKRNADLEQGAEFRGNV